MAIANMSPENFPTRILRLPEVLQLVGLSKSTVYSQIDAGEFPSPKRLGNGRAVGWTQISVIQWIDDRDSTGKLRQ